MKLPRDLFGRDLADHLTRYWRYVEIRHIVLRTEEPSGQTLIPAHKPLKTGTLAPILRMISDHKKTSRDQILHFF